MTDYLRRNEYLQRYDRIAEEHAWRPSSPASLMESWEQTVDGFTLGYSDNLDEFHADLQVRGQIDVVLNAPELQGFDELAEMRRVIGLVDARYRDITLEAVSTPDWWRGRVLIRGGRE